MVKDIIQKQREFFLTNKTLDLEFRKDALLKLKKSLLEHKEELFDAFLKDFNKNSFDVITSEFISLINEINFMVKHMKKFFKPKTVSTGIINFPSKGKILHEPYGNVLIISPRNYPLLLSIDPVIGAIAGGNTVILRPSESTKHVSDVIEKILSDFDDGYIKVFRGDRALTQELLDEKFDFIFFTGSVPVGRMIYEKASKHLTPVCLELGGKSPCIVDKDADLKIACKRIVWGKFLNAGQTCVAPDNVLVHESIKDEFVKGLIKEIKLRYYSEGKLTNEFPFVINKKQFDRLVNLIDENKVAFGGKHHDLLIEPTVINNVTYDDPIMQEEIFGPLLPILTFKDINEEIKKINKMEHPLALYYFGKNKEAINNVMNKIRYGGGCINDTIMHLTPEKLGFGGVGQSGLYSYHGFNSLRLFTHEKSVLVKGKLEFNTKYLPHTKKKFKFIEKMINK